MKKIAIVGAIVLVATLLAGSSVLAGSLLGGNAVIDREYKDTYSNFTTIDTNNPFNFTGELTEWEIYAEATLPVQLLIIRNLDGDTGHFDVVGQSPLETPSALGLNTFSLDPSLPVQAGDYIGVYHQQTGVVSFDKLEEPWAYFEDFSHLVLQTANNGGGGSPAILSCERVYSIQATGDPYYLTVDIDIKPGSDPNSINLKDQGMLPVAILGSEAFYVDTINPETIEVGGVDLATRGSAKAPKLAYSYEDVNEDGYMDLVAFFGVQDLVGEKVLTGTTVELVLTANTIGEQPVEGKDSVRIVPE